MKLHIELRDGTHKNFTDIAHARYNPQRGILIVRHYDAPDTLACPQIYKINVESVQAITLDIEERNANQR